MEPKILMIGRVQSTLDELASKLKTQGRNVLVSTNSNESIQSIIRSNKIEAVVIGAGLSDLVREETLEFIRSLEKDLPVHMIRREESSGPNSMIQFVNNIAAEFKKHESLGKKMSIQHQCKVDQQLEQRAIAH